MNGIGLDCGNATLKLVLLSPEGKFLWEKTASHYGAVVQSARRLLGELLAADPGACGCPVVITGNAGDRLKAGCNALAVLGDISRLPWVHRAVPSATLDKGNKIVPIILSGFSRLSIRFFRFCGEIRRPVGKLRRCSACSKIIHDFFPLIGYNGYRLYI